ncbi:MAG: carboxypeptidase-like regulatory domain-containing protein [Planctomycetaceae bacterium]|jgi:hypothetical protein|nr:carboxypeptidase-like regulatory domain-containing protein [Planctomycetaceae bacterium]
MKKLNSLFAMSKNMTNILFWVFFLMTFAIVGCGNPGVRGKVVYSDDKSPLPRGVVNFVKDGFIARGQIDSNGNYVIGSKRAGDGLPAGEYKVYITGTSREINPNLGGGLERIINPKYEQPTTSGLELSVKGSQTFNIEVERFD